MKGSWFVIGTFVGIIVALAALLIRYAMGKKDQYDERQTAARGKAYRAGMISVMIYLWIYLMIEAMGVRWHDGLFGPALGVVVGVFAFGLTAVLKDAYISLNETPKGALTFFFLVGAANLLIGFSRVRTAKRIVIPGSEPTEGIVTFDAISIVLGAALLLLGAVTVARLLYLRRSQKEDAE